MHSVDKLRGESSEHVLFCFALFEDKLCKVAFKSRGSDAMKFKFVDNECERYLVSLNQPPAL